MNSQGVKRMQKDETLENYLETILILTEKKGNIRAIDISNEMNYAKATISIMLKKYAEAGYLVVEENGNIVIFASVKPSFCKNVCNVCKALSLCVFISFKVFPTTRTLIVHSPKSASSTRSASPRTSTKEPAVFKKSIPVRSVYAPITSAIAMAQPAKRDLFTITP